MIPVTSKQLIERAAQAAARRIRKTTFAEGLRCLTGGEVRVHSRWQWQGRSLRSLRINLPGMGEEADNMPFSVPVEMIVNTDPDILSGYLADILSLQYSHQKEQFERGEIER